MTEQRRSPLLPQFHVRLPRGYVNDPNGPVLIDGVVHLYFQSRPLADLRVPVEWGHASTPDLVHWTLHRPALSPVPGGLDDGGAWSGNTILAGDVLRAYYCGFRDDHVYQSVLLAESRDGGRSFGEPVQVVADPAPSENVTMCRDPFVWREGDTWHLVTGAARAGGVADGGGSPSDGAGAGPREVAAIRHHVSRDGVDWSGAQELASRPRGTTPSGVDTGAGWECPQILEVGGRRAALVSSWSPETGPIRALAFALDDPGSPLHLLDDGPDFYAASVMRGDAGAGTGAGLGAAAAGLATDTVVFGWVTEARSEAAWREDGWAGAISLPRTVHWSGDRLASTPHPALAALRTGPDRPADGAETGAQAEFEMPAGDGFVHLVFGDGERLEFAMSDGTLVVDRSASSRDPRAEGSPVTVTDAGLGPVRIFVDGSVVEVFTATGRAATFRVYPESPPPWSVEASAGTRLWHLASTVSPRSAP